MNHKKHLFLAVFLSVFSNASVTLAETRDTIGSADACRTSLTRTHQGLGFYPISLSRLSSSTAALRAASLLRLGAEVSITRDSLGVERYRTVTAKQQMEVSGDASDACTGLTTASLVEVCTTDLEGLLIAACETFCQVEWQGQDCR